MIETALLLALAAQGEAPACVDTAADRVVRVAVYDFDPQNVDERTARVVTGAVVDEVRKLDRVAVIGMDEVRTMLAFEAEKQLAGCEADSCLAEIAEALGADLVVTGTLARVGDEHVFGLRVVDQREGKARASASKRLVAEDGEEFLAAVGPLVEEVFPDRPLRPGQTRGVPPEIALRLNPPPVPPWAFWTGVGAVGAVGVAGGALSTLWALRQGDFAAFREQPVLSGPELKARTAELQLVEGAMWTAWGVAGAAAVVVGATAFFTDFAGYQAAAE